MFSCETVSDHVVFAITVTYMFACSLELHSEKPNTTPGLFTVIDNDTYHNMIDQSVIHTHDLQLTADKYFLENCVILLAALLCPP